MNALVPYRLWSRGDTRVLWTDEAIENAKRLSAEGKSAAEIADTMREENPGVTRNSVIGKLHRMGCAGGGRQPNKERSAIGKFMRTKSRAAPQIPRSGLRPTVQAPRVGQGVRQRSERVERYVERAADPVQKSAWITIVDLNESVCHFPRGTPGRDDFAYCGASIEEGARYCGGHRRIMYAPR
jgi:GcrA cell cycle regulator